MNNLIFVFIKKISLHFPQNGVNDVDRHLLMHLEIVPFFYLPLLILLPLVNLVVISFRSRGRDDLILSFAFQLHTLWEEANIRSNKKKPENQHKHTNLWQIQVQTALFCFGSKFARDQKRKIFSLESERESVKSSWEKLPARCEREKEESVWWVNNTAGLSQNTTHNPL